MHDWHEKFFQGEALELWRRAIPVEETEREIAFLQEVLDLAEGAAVLDVPCGNGRLSLPFALSGCNVTGIDSSRDFIDEASSSAMRHRTKIDYIRSDMRLLNYQNKFDGAFCMGNSFGYFDRAGTCQFISAVGAALKSGAKFVLDSLVTAESFLVNGAEHDRYDCRRSCVETAYTFIRNGKEEQHLAVHWIYTSGEICSMLEQAGFTIIELFEDVDFNPYSLGADRLLLVAQKL
jgi:cyclopropane fatty-acyl-phospholipid synthase-like methyltransferase